MDIELDRSLTYLHSKQEQYWKFGFRFDIIKPTIDSVWDPPNWHLITLNINLKPLFISEQKQEKTLNYV